MKLLSIIALLFISNLAISAEYVWTYSGAKINDQWVNHSGVAKLKFNNRLIQAELFDSKVPNFLRYTLNGKVIDDKVFVTLNVLNSDSPVLKFEGTVTTINSKTVFMLSDGFSFIAIRESSK